MRVRILSAAVAAMLATTAPIGAAQSQFCKPGDGADGKIKLDYDIRPSLVVADETLDVPMSAVSIGGGGEGAFSFSRTIGAILKSAGQPDDPAARTTFLRTMIASLDNDGQALLNPYSAVVVSVDDRFLPDGDDGTGEGSLDPSRLLNADDAEFGVKPLALFNRLDLAPSTFEHCGEYRIVYAIPNGGFEKRFLLIFEAMLPNPHFKTGDPVASEAGCRPVAEFWAGLRDVPGADDAAKLTERAKRLSQFYYDGAVEAQPDLEAFEPVVSFHHYGGDGGRGQVRANMFFEGGWQLREWLTPLTVGPNGPTVAFVPETVKDNPISELYLDDVKATALGQANIESTILAFHADFIEHFGTEVQDHLLVERSQKFRDLRNRLLEFDLGGLDEDDLLVTTIGLGSSKRFDDFQSHSNPDPDIDEPSKTAGPKFRKMLDLLLSRPEQVPGADQGLNKQTTQILLNRAEAGTCSGCHQTAPREGIAFSPAVVKVKPNGTEVFWPDVVAGVPGFVHVDEDRNLSVALEEHFLPVRRYMMGLHLCKDLPDAEPAAPASEPAAAYYVEQVIEQQMEKGKFAIGFSASDSPVEALAALPATDQAEAIDEIATQREAAREREQATPGAFVEVRRSH